MKFNTTLEAQSFMTDVKAFDKLTSASESYVPTTEELKSFIKKRTPLVKKIKDHRKSVTQKSNWRKNRHKMMVGIKAFHRSVDGKRFHRRLGKFIATRITRKKTNVTENLFSTLMAKQNSLKGLTSAKQHLFVELEYYHTLDEQVEIEELIIDYALPLFRDIEVKIVSGEELNDNDMNFLFDITDHSAIISALAEKIRSGCTAEQNNPEVAKVEKLWNSILDKLAEDDLGKENEDFYSEFISEFVPRFKTLSGNESEK